MVWAALLGGLALFVWGAIAHQALGLVESQLKPLPGDRTANAELLRRVAPEPGVYLNPWYAPDAPKAEREALPERLKVEPYVLAVVVPQGFPQGIDMTSTLVRQAGLCVALALIAVFLIVVAGGLSGLVARVTFCVLLALFGFLQTDAPFMLWYQFPSGWTIAQLVEKLVGGALLGVVIHFVLGKKR
jgi:hypothetical protein